MSHFFDKKVGEIETFAIDWTNYLVDANDGSPDTIATATWTVETAEGSITKVADSISGNKTLIQVSGGTANNSYKCQCKITLTSGSDTPIRHIVVQVAADPVSA